MSALIKYRSLSSLSLASAADGLLDIRLAASRDGLTARYVPAANGRGSWIPLGLNRCAQMSPAQDPAGMQWCDKTAQLSTTSRDTAAMYMTQGLVKDPDGEQLHLYYMGDPMTHGGYDGLPQDVYRNRGIMRVDLRVDGNPYPCIFH
jgi:hypothetical protein